MDANLETYQMGAHFEALDERALLVPLDPRYTQVGFNLLPVQVCYVLEVWCILVFSLCNVYHYCNESKA